MNIEKGTRLGPYEIVDSIGAGGMGEVWRAKDTRLDREVAIKILPQGFAENEQFLQRFEREAKAISSLNHPNICTLYDVGEARDEGRETRGEGEADNRVEPESSSLASSPSPLTRYLVMELIEGESLADRLKKGPLGLHEVLMYGRQIASALDAAHRKGVIHRDLKPGNIMLTRSGAKLLDFGLAKTAAEGQAPTDGLTSMATEAKPLTQEGTILGTFQYMAPEQLDGIEADARTDIFAFGAVLYEMATGKRAFSGETKSSLIASIVSSQPEPISRVTPMSPPALDHVVRRCLEKDPEDRWQSAHDVASELQWISEAGSQAGVAAPVTMRRKTRERLAWTVAVVAVVLAAILSFLLFRAESDAPRATVSHILPPEGTTFDFTQINSGSLAVSPNGEHVAFTALEESGARSLWIRTLDEPEPRRLSGTVGALHPFWSPDSRFVAFFADSKLKKVDISGAPPLTLCDAPNGRSGAWNEDGVILFSPDTTKPIHRVSAEGGEPVPATTLRSEQGETTHRWARFLPDGNHFLYMAGTHTLGTQSESNAIMIGSLDSVEDHELLFHARSNVDYSAGHLIYVRDDVLVAHPFDPDRLELTGDPFRIADEARFEDGFFRGVFSVSNEETLVYQTGISDPTSQLVWLDRSGNELSRVGAKARYQFFTLSPDGRQLAYMLASESDGTTDIWLYDLERNVPSRFTFGELNEGNPIWSPDGSRIAFYAGEDPGNALSSNLYVAPARGTSKPELLISSDKFTFPVSWSPDGETLGVAEFEGSDGDSRLLHVEDGEVSDYLVSDEFSEMGPFFSPDGDWAMYVSDESGVFEIYVAPFPGPGGKWQITSGGNQWGAWVSDDEIWYRTADGRFWSIDVDTSDGSFRSSPPELLFDNDEIQGWNIAPDGERILATIRSGDDPNTPLTLVRNWTAMARR